MLRATRMLNDQGCNFQVTWGHLDASFPSEMETAHWKSQPLRKAQFPSHFSLEDCEIAGHYLRCCGDERLACVAVSHKLLHNKSHILQTLPTIQTLRRNLKYLCTFSKYCSTAASCLTTFLQYPQDFIYISVTSAFKYKGIGEIRMHQWFPS